MRILLDHCMPKGFSRKFPALDVRTGRQMGWERFENATLIEAAAMRFDVFLTVDKKNRLEQDLDRLPMPVIVLNAISNAMPVLVAYVPHVEALLKTPLEPVLYVVELDGQIVRLGKPIRP
jgi:hypothetical protein